MQIRILIATKILGCLGLLTCQSPNKNVPETPLSLFASIMASAIFFLDLKGKTLLARNYRGDIPMSAVEKFMPLLLDAEEDNAAPPPCISSEGVNVRFNNEYHILMFSIYTYDIVIFIFSLLQNEIRMPSKSSYFCTKSFKSTPLVTEGRILTAGHGRIFQRIRRRIHS